MKYKTIVSTMVGVLGGILTSLVGELTINFKTLLLFMLIDLLSGFTCAAIFKQSTKTDSGGLSSAAMTKGVAKKVGMLLLIAVAYRVGLALSTAYLRDAVVIALIVEEAISILENLGKMGIKIPSVLSEAIDVLNKKVIEKEVNDEGN